jgi:hypothetical protein
MVADQKIFKHMRITCAASIELFSSRFAISCCNNGNDVCTISLSGPRVSLQDELRSNKKMPDRMHKTYLCLILTPVDRGVLISLLEIQSSISEVVRWIYSLWSVLVALNELPDSKQRVVHLQDVSRLNVCEQCGHQCRPPEMTNALMLQLQVRPKPHSERYLLFWEIALTNRLDWLCN